MRDPRESNFWGESFMGDHRGVVSNGPFQRWRQRNGAFLERNGGGSGSMISPRGIRNVLSRSRNIDILSPWANGRYGLENYHDAYVLENNFIPNRRPFNQINYQFTQFKNNKLMQFCFQNSIKENVSVF